MTSTKELPVTRSEIKQVAKAIYDELKKSLGDEFKLEIIAQLRKDIADSLKDYEPAGLRMASKSLEIGLDQRVGELESRVAINLAKSLEDYVGRHMAKTLQPYQDTVVQEMTNLRKNLDEKTQALAKSYADAQAMGLAQIKSVLDAIPTPQVIFNAPESKPPDVVVHVPQGKAPEVTVNVPELHSVVNVPQMRAPDVVVHVPEYKPPELQPVFNLPAALPAEVVVNIPEAKAPEVNVHVPELKPTITVQAAQPRLVKKHIEYDQYNRPIHIEEQEIDRVN